MSAATRIDWTNVINFDCYGSIWGYDTVEKAEAAIEEARANGAAIDEWYVRDPKGVPIRIVRTTALDDRFLGGIDISVFPGECPDCGVPVTTLAWVSEEHHAKCPRRNPHF